MKILIVDDDYVSLTKMATILEDTGSCTTVENGTDALKEFTIALDDGDPFDLVTLDIHMPDMDGKEALYKIRAVEEQKQIAQSNRVKVIMVTAHSDKESLITCFQSGCDDFVVKPFNKATLSEKIDKVLPNRSELLKKTPKQDKQAESSDEKSEENVVILEVSSALKKGRVSMPSLPDIHTRLREMIKSGTDLLEMTELLKQDVMIASELISISNSVLMGGLEKNTTIEQAIGRLGLDNTIQQVEMVCQKTLYSDVANRYSDYVERLWKHSLSCACASQNIASYLELKFREDPFMLGLTHDIGKLVLLQIIGKLEDAGNFGKKVDTQVLIKTISNHHSQFGATLLDRWGFSDTYLQTARFHHDLVALTPESKELSLVSFSNVLVKKLDTPSDRIIIESDIAAAAARNLGLDTRMIDNLKPLIQKLIDEKVSAA